MTIRGLTFRFSSFDLDSFRELPPGGGRSPSPGVTSPLESSSVEDAWKVAGDVAGDEFCDPAQRQINDVKMFNKYCD